MGYIRDAKALVDRLYAYGSTNNEDLQQLLILLKEISDSNPESLKDEFLEVFADLDITEETLKSTGIMLMIFLTRLGMSYKATQDSSSFINKRQMESDLVIKLREAELSFRNYFHSEI